MTDTRARVDITARFDAATLTGRTIRVDGITGRVVLCKHIAIDPNTGLSHAGFEPGVVIELRATVGGVEATRFMHLPYGATIDVLDPAHH